MDGKLPHQSNYDCRRNIQYCNILGKKLYVLRLKSGFSPTFSSHLNLTTFEHYRRGFSINYAINLTFEPWKSIRFSRPWISMSPFQLSEIYKYALALNPVSGRDSKNDMSLSLKYSIFIQILYIRISSSEDMHG